MAFCSEERRERSQVAVEALPVRFAESLEEARLSAFPQAFGTREDVPALGGQVDRLAALPTLCAQTHQTGGLERLQVAAQRGPVHRESLRQPGDRRCLIDIDRGENGELRRVHTR